MGEKLVSNDRNKSKLKNQKNDDSLKSNGSSDFLSADVGIKEDENAGDVISEWRKKREARLKQRVADRRGSTTLDRSGSAEEVKVLVTHNNDNSVGYSKSLGGENFDEDNTDENDELNLDEEEYYQGDTMTAAKRLKLEEKKVLLMNAVNTKATNGLAGDQKRIGGRRRQLLESVLGNDRTVQDDSHKHDNNNDDNNDFLPLSRSVDDSDDHLDNQEDRHPDRHEDILDDGTRKNNEVVESLLESVAALQRKAMTAEERAALERGETEARIMREASKVQTNALQAAHDLAQGVTYENPMPTTWKPPRHILNAGPDAWQKVRDEYHMQVQGDDIPPPLTRFADMKFPLPIMDCLDKRHITKPTPIQIQGLPVALACRDMVGIAFTGSGKTLTFSLPMVMMALEEEMRMPLTPGEGPIGIVLAPSRELARQTYDLVCDFCTALGHHQQSQQPPPNNANNNPHKPNNSFPQLRCQLLIGGESIRDQMDVVKTSGVHCVVATPGRLRDILKRKAMNLSICRYICLDEADRMLDMGFDEEVREIMNYFTNQRQTLLFSATFPRKFQDFARQTLVKPIIVNVGRAGAASLDVIQEVEYVKDEAKIVYLLHCLQKTAPPVIIFCERKGSADDIHEYLLLKGVEAVSIHGGKDQAERNEAIQLFKEGKKDVLIATDIAAKGLDFPAIQHVINFDMPSEIENYVHRIGRTGRAGKTGVATTFINKSCDETTLLDLKALLTEAKQRIPPVLMMLDDPREKNGGLGCSFCGGLGHTIVDCPKIDKDARRVAGSHKDVLVTGGGNW